MTATQASGGPPAAAPAAGPRAAAAGLALRPATEADLPFLERVYGETRAGELAASGWSEAQKAAFVAMQFEAQHAHYRRYYPDAAWLVVLHAGVPAGRLYREAWADQHRVIDIALLPEHCGRGLGTALLADLIDEAAAAGKAVTIHVEKTSPAIRLYRRLGFVREADKGVYDLMRLAPQGTMQNLGDVDGQGAR